MITLEINMVTMSCYEYLRSNQNSFSVKLQKFCFNFWSNQDNSYFFSIDKIVGSKHTSDN